jgi:hypothetical protein
MFAGNRMSIADQISQLKSLYDSGALTQEEFSIQKEAVLAGSNTIESPAFRISKSKKRISLEAKTTLVFILVPFIFIFILFIISALNGRIGIESYVIQDVMTVIGPLGPNYIVMFSMNIPIGIYYLIAGFSFLYVKFLLIGVFHLFILYKIMRNEGKFSKNSRLAVLISIFVYCVFSYAVMLFLVRDEMLGAISMPVTALALLIIRASFGSFSSKTR